MEFNDLRAQYEHLKEPIDEAMASVVAEAAFIGGARVAAFEEELAAFAGRRHCVSCGNGTDAVMLALMALGVGEGDAVFCPAMTFTASAEPAAMLGATPVFCDIDSASYNIDPASLEEAIAMVEAGGALRPKAVVAVDFLGNPADMEGVGRVCERHGMVLLEDAAQGMGGAHGGRRLGSFGVASATSFFPSKPLGCYGDGGAVLTDDDGLAALMRSLACHGKGEDKYDNVRVGMNSRLDGLQAAVLSAKLPSLEWEIGERGRVAGVYAEALGEVVACPQVVEGDVSAFAQYVVLLRDREERDGLAEALHKEGVPSLLYYPRPLTAMPAYAGSPSVACLVSESYAERNLGLPFSAYLEAADQEKVVDVVLRFMDGRR